MASFDPSLQPPYWFEPTGGALVAWFDPELLGNTPVAVPLAAALTSTSVIGAALTTAPGATGGGLSFSAGLAIGSGLSTGDGLRWGQGLLVGTTAQKPAAPTISLTAGNTTVSIAWTDNGSGGATITSHKIYRGTTPGGETYVATTSGASPYSDTGLVNGTTYYYKLSAVNIVGEGPLSEEASATPSAYSPSLDYSIAANSQYMFTLVA